MVHWIYVQVLKGRIKFLVLPLPWLNPVHHCSCSTSTNSSLWWNLSYAAPGSKGTRIPHQGIGSISVCPVESWSWTRPSPQSRWHWRGGTCCWGCSSPSWPREWPQYQVTVGHLLEGGDCSRIQLLCSSRAGRAAWLTSLSAPAPSHRWE